MKADQNRGKFLGTAFASGAAATLPFILSEKKTHSSETLFAQLYNSLNEKQKSAICFDFDHKLRLAVDNNWYITKTRLSNSYTPDQQALVKEIFMGLHGRKYAKKVYDQVVHDSGLAGFGDSSIALFGSRVLVN